MMKKDFLNGVKLLQDLALKNKYFEIVDNVSD